MTDFTYKEQKKERPPHPACDPRNASLDHPATLQKVRRREIINFFRHPHSGLDLESEMYPGFESTAAICSVMITPRHTKKVNQRRALFPLDWLHSAFNSLSCLCQCSRFREHVLDVSHWTFLLGHLRISSPLPRELNGFSTEHSFPSRRLSRPERPGQDSASRTRRKLLTFI